MTFAVAQDTTKTTAPKTSATKGQTSTKKSQTGSSTKSGDTKKTGPSASQPAALTNPKSKLSYALGMNLGSNLRLQQIDVDANILTQGIKDGLSGAKTQMTDEEARTTLEQWQTDMRQQRQQKTQQESDDRGTLVNGTEFDSSYKRGEPATFPVTGVIKGWTEALQLMPVGSKWQLYIPSDLAYGPPGRGPIPPNSTLIFDIELLSIQPQQPQTPPSAPAATPPPAQPQTQPQQQPPAQAQPPAPPPVQPKTPPVTPK
ncbi:MAG: hypothetical protein DMG65_17925 [Candidatus Angelobacter sp. Gp1-AA117]|nr:MAG: hypothetical protein DMG65_17925 [Candidatus Angelobacter sp. Gp1-AA117]